MRAPEGVEPPAISDWPDPRYQSLAPVLHDRGADSLTAKGRKWRLLHCEIPQAKMKASDTVTNVRIGPLTQYGELAASCHHSIF